MCSWGHRCVASARDAVACWRADATAALPCAGRGCVRASCTIHAQGMQLARGWFPLHPCLSQIPALLRLGARVCCCEREWLQPQTCTVFHNRHRAAFAAAVKTVTIPVASDGSGSTAPSSRIHEPRAPNLLPHAQRERPLSLHIDFTRLQLRPLTGLNARWRRGRAWRAPTGSSPYTSSWHAGEVH